MKPVVPRWEWRAFGENFGAAEARFASLAPQQVQESDELYLLSSGATPPSRSAKASWTSSGCRP